MMNNVGELYSLIHFLRIKPYNSFQRFSEDIGQPLRGTSTRGYSQAMKKLQALIKAIMLRRTKKSQIDGKPILTLPERTTEMQHAVFNEDEESFYRALEQKAQIQFNRYVKAGTVGKNYQNALVLLLRLRQACCHPHLIQHFQEDSPVVDLTIQDMEVLARQLEPDVIARIKDSDGVFECPVCYDAVDNPRIFI